MSILVCDPALAERMLADRRACGGDRHDEMWDGVYVMSPLANNEHQFLIHRLTAVFAHFIVEPDEGRIFPGCNVSDRMEGWEHNYRCPDIAVFLAANPAKDCGTHWFGGPDLAFEILSKGDRSREKLDFYARLQARELWILDRNPWQIELYQLRDGQLLPAGLGVPGAGDYLGSSVLPFESRLAVGQERPVIEVRAVDGSMAWRI